MLKIIKTVLLILIFLLPISFARNLSKSDISTVKSPDSLSNMGNNFFGIGFVLGSPASLSLTTGLYFQHVSIRISGGAWGTHWYGLQGEIAFPITKSNELIQNASIIAGLFATKVFITDPNYPAVQYYQYNKQNYIGFAYDVYYAGFLMQTGLGFGKGSFPNPQFLFQFGYLFNFNL
jgi:hypothetical protein